MTKLKIETLVVERYKSGESEGELRPFAIPEDATIVAVRPTMEAAHVTYVRPA